MPICTRQTDFHLRIVIVLPCGMNPAAGRLGILDGQILSCLCMALLRVWELLCNMSLLLDDLEMLAAAEMGACGGGEADFYRDLLRHYAAVRTEGWIDRQTEQP
jgi:hypothetical protein